MTNYAEDLAAYDDDFAEYEVKENVGERLPDGTYQAEIKEARVERTSGEYENLQFTLVFEILNGDYEGVTHHKWINLDSEMGRKIVKQDVFNLKLPLEKLSELPAMTPMIVGLKVRIRVKYRKSGEKTYTNTYINKLLDDSLETQEGVSHDNDPW